MEINKGGLNGTSSVTMKPNPKANMVTSIQGSGKKSSGTNNNDNASADFRNGITEELQKQYGNK